jgi:uncharacterized protein YdaT
MPWTPSDGPSRHTKKANTPASRKQWAAVANKVLDESGDDGKAVRIANAAVAKHKSHFGLAKAHGE